MKRSCHAAPTGVVWMFCKELSAWFLQCKMFTLCFVLLVGLVRGCYSMPTVPVLSKFFLSQKLSGQHKIAHLQYYLATQRQPDKPPANALLHTSYTSLHRTLHQPLSPTPQKIKSPASYLPMTSLTLCKWVGPGESPVHFLQFTTEILGTSWYYYYHTFNSVFNMWNELMNSC